MCSMLAAEPRELAWTFGVKANLGNRTMLELLFEDVEVKRQHELQEPSGLGEHPTGCRERTKK